MSYVIYNTKTFKLRKKANGYDSHFDTKRGAKMAFTKAKLNSDNWKIATHDEYVLAEPLVEVKNMMSGKPVMIRASDVGTCCDPSTDRYWTM